MWRKFESQEFVNVLNPLHLNPAACLRIKHREKTLDEFLSLPAPTLLLRGLPRFGRVKSVSSHAPGFF